VNDKKGQLIATVNLTEVDVPKVKADQKVTLTLDAYSDKTFTGKVLAVNTSGTVSSGVTSYPVTILLDPVPVDIYPNMAVSVEIIIAIKPDVVMIPVSAVTMAGNTATVQVMKAGKPSAVSVEVGDSNGTNIEIKSGISEGDSVVTATNSTATSSSSSATTTSPFSGLGRSTTGTRGTGTGARNAVFIQGGPGGF
jgi:multidrug efflux pump subunit AcrA (membrane-fusion protein)